MPVGVFTEIEPENTDLSCQLDHATFLRAFGAVVKEKVPVLK
jgi:hypothetical protein